MKFMCSLYLICAWQLFVQQNTDSSEQKGDAAKEKEAEPAENGKETKGKKDNGAPAKKKKQQVKTVELRIDSTAPGLTSAQLREKVDREVGCVRQAFCWSDSFRTKIKEKQIGALYSTCFASVKVPIVVTSFIVIVIVAPWPLIMMMMLIIIAIMIIICNSEVNLSSRWYLIYSILTTAISNLT